MDKLVSDGKIHYFGCSNWSAWQLQKAMDMANYLNFAAPVASIQQQYSLLERNLELDLLDVCKNEGVGILPWSPLKVRLNGTWRGLRDLISVFCEQGGWLAGKYGKEKPTEGRVACE
jgi:aryl-alcohol dehydrogenase-like predicted oxidoreductase